MTRVDLEGQLAAIGRGVVQANVKLGRIAQWIEQGGEAGAGEELEALFDLVDGIERALERRRPGGWWRRGQEDVWLGLELALRGARERLGRMGIVPSADGGAVDPLVQRVVEVVPGGVEGEVARTLRRGWVRVEGEGRRVLRTADVAAYGGRR